MVTIIAPKRQVRRALCWGINKFRGLPGSDLQGCVNDANNMSTLLREVYGYEVRTLLDADGSKGNLVDGLAWTRDGAKPGDIRGFTASTHGTQIDDQDGDEPDRLDEALVCANISESNWLGGLLTDDFFRRDHFGLMPAGVISFGILDACHSGSGTRDLARFQLRHAPRFIPAHLSGKRKRYRARHLLRAEDGGAQNWIALSGCEDSGTSADAYIDGKYHGACTWALLQALKGNPNRTWRDAWQTVRLVLAREGYDQKPVLSGRPDLLDMPIFGGAIKKAA